MLSFGNILIALLFWLCVSGIIYTYAGYPLLIFVLAGFRKKSSFPAAPLPSVTLLIAAYNEESAIETKIKNCLALDYPKDRIQILITTDGSSDNTPEIVKKYSTSGIELLHQPERRGKMAAINRAMDAVRGEIVLFSDANNNYLPDTITKMVTPFNDPKVGGVSGEKVIEKDDGNLGASEGAYWKYESFVKRQESRLGSCTSAAGEILAIRKSLYIAPPSHVINDDFYIAMQILRQGYRLLYAPNAKSIERVSPTAKDMANQILPWNHPILIWQIVSHKFLRPLVPFFMIGALLGNLLAVVFPSRVNNFLLLSYPVGIILLGTQCVFYIIAFAGMQISERGKQTRLMNLFYLPTFLLNSNLAAMKGIVRFISGGQTHLWEKIQRR